MVAAAQFQFITDVIQNSYCLPYNQKMVILYCQEKVKISCKIFPDLIAPLLFITKQVFSKFCLNLSLGSNILGRRMSQSNTSSAPLKGETLATLLKVLAGLAVFVPLLAAYFQYRQSVRQDLDNDFRTVVTQLSSENREERLAAASSTGTFIVKGGPYYNEAIDILINRLSIELDYNVLNAVRGSLLKIDEAEYKRVIEQILDIDRNIFNQEYVLEIWRDDAKKNWEESKKIYSSLEEEASNSDLKNDMLLNQKKQINDYQNTYLNLKKEFDELSRHKQVAADFLSSLFSKVTRLAPIENLEFSNNSLNYVNMSELNLINSAFRSSALSASNITHSNFNGSIITNTTFGYSNLTGSRLNNCRIEASLFNQANLTKADFSDSELKDVFFVGAELNGTKFTGTKGLKTIYFYRADNIDQAIFDSDFKKQLEKDLSAISENEFKAYVENSELTNQRVEEIFNAIY